MTSRFPTRRHRQAIGSIQRAAELNGAKVQE
jgi:hypothetical protein